MTGIVLRQVAAGEWEVVNETEVEACRGWSVRIPAGFRTDLASVPRLLWPIISPFELGTAAPVVHDWAYRGGVLVRDGTLVSPTRRQADWLLRDIAERDDTVASWRPWVAWVACRLFARSDWGRHGAA